MGLNFVHYLLTPWSRALLEKLTGSVLVKKFPAFYGIRRFIIAFTSARHLSWSWANLIQSIPPHPTSWRSILILSSHLRLGSPQWSLSLRFPQFSYISGEYLALFCEVLKAYGCYVCAVCVCRQTCVYCMSLLKRKTLVLCKWNIIKETSH